jgi:hypothetical protein
MLLKTAFSSQGYKIVPLTGDQPCRRFPPEWPCSHHIRMLSFFSGSCPYCDGIGFNQMVLLRQFKCNVCCQDPTVIRKPVMASIIARKALYIIVK